VWKRLWLAIALECSLMICNACEWTKALSHSGLGSGNGQQWLACVFCASGNVKAPCLWHFILKSYPPRPPLSWGVGQFFGCVKTIVISDRFGMFVDDLQRLWVDKGAVSFWAGKWKRPAIYIHIHVYVYNQLLECTSLMNKSINHMY
jgi:hypothetical protein